MEVRPGYKQTEVGVIPEEWNVRPLGELGEALIGLTYKPSDVREHGTLVLRSSNIQNDALAFDDNVFVDTDIPERIKVRPGDVLVCVRNGSRDLIGKTALLDARAVGMTFGAFMAVYRSPIGRLASYLFQSEILKRQINEHLGATINQITNKSLNSFRIPVSPHDDERRAIATALSDVDALLAGLDRGIAKKRDLKRAAMQQLLTGQTRLPGFSEEWKASSFAELLTYERPDQFIVRSADYDESSNTPVLTANKSFVLGFTSERTGIYSDLPAIIFDDFTTDSKCVDFPFKVKSSAIKILKPRRADVSLRFVFERMQLCDFQPGEHKRYYISEYQHITLPTPEPNEQTAIAIVLSDMDAEIKALEARRNKTRDLKQAMMQELLTGKTRLVQPEAAYAA